MDVARWTLRALLAIALGVTACGDPAPDRSRVGPNVLLYVVDTLRADALGAYGHPRVETPALDALAAEGWLFERVYAPSSWTRPSVASLLTGAEPGAHGVNGRDEALPAGARLLSEELRASGYATAGFVTNPNVGSFFGFDQGFDHYEELYARREPGRVGSGELVTRAGEVTERAIAWLDEATEPFFLFALTTDPHWPYDPPASFDRYGGDYRGPVRDGGDAVKRADLGPADRERVRAFYHGEVSANDAAFGALLEQLRQRGLADSTLVVFTADHGEEFWEHGRHGHGRQLFEESIRVPLVFAAPGLEARRAEAPVALIDVAPTILDLLGLPAPAASQGRSLAGGAADGERRLHVRLDRGDDRVDALIAHPWKLIRDGASGRSALFDLRGDPRERRDLAAVEARRVDALNRELAARAEANARQRARLGGEAAPVPSDALPAEARQALEALGYLEEDGP